MKTKEELDALLALRDDDIIRRAELWATGATIHDVKGLIGAYRTATAAIDGWTKDGRYKNGWKDCGFAIEFMAVILNQLNAFMQHGDYRKACRDFPLPKHPKLK